MFMLKLYLVRHGQTFWNVEKRIQGQAESDLTPEGVRQSELLGKRLSQVEFDCIYVSPLRRTLQTLKAMSVNGDVPVVEDRELVEDLKRDYPEEIECFWTKPHAFNRATCETYKQVYDRGVEFVRSVVEKYKSGNILVVTHGAFLKILFTYFRYLQLHDIPQVVHPFSTALSVVELKDGAWNMHFWNDFTHLE